VITGVRFVDGEEQSQQAAQSIIPTRMRPGLDTQLLTISLEDRRVAGGQVVQRQVLYLGAMDNEILTSES
jgi:hypothetical protein